MEDGDSVLLRYIKQGMNSGNNINDLKVNAMKKGYSAGDFDLALAQAHEFPVSTDNEIIEKPKEKKSLAKHIFGIPSNFIFPLTWTIFFIVLGIIVQSISSGSFIFLQFFSSNLFDWLGKFNFFSSTTAYTSVWGLIQSLADGWYYFGFIGGLVSLLWVFIAWILNKFKKE